MNKKYFAVFAVVVAAFLSLLYVTRGSNDQVVAQDTACQTAIGFVRPVQGEIVSNFIPIELPTTDGVAKVIFELDGNSIGRGSLDPTSGNLWRMVWDTRYAQPGPNRILRARIKYTSGYECFTQPVIISIANPQQTPLQTTINPPNWSGPTNNVVLFAVDFPNAAPGTTLDIAKYADVVWSVSGRGTISAEPYSKARFYSGPEGGNGSVKARVFYGGQIVQLEAPTNIVNQYVEPNTGTNTGTNQTSNNTTTTVNSTNQNTTSPTGENSDATATTSNQPVSSGQAITRIVEEDDYTKSCIISKLGKEAFDALIAENRRPRSGEFQAIYSCFARQNYVLPSALAPVAPEQVKSRAESKKVAIKQIRNSTKLRAEDNSQQTLLVLEGTATPNVNVLLYVFSEPLVLATTTDADGNWSYSLEDPLENGQHEVYALVDGGDGEYERSSVSSFFIGSAEATEANPNGFSLDLAAEPTISASNRSVNLFIAATIGTVVFMLTLVLGFLIIHSRDRKARLTTVGQSDEEIFRKPDDEQGLSQSHE